MSVYNNPSQLTTLNLGVKVSRATATLPQTATGGLFTVTGGRVLVTAILGEVTVAIQNQANNTKLVATPTTGSVNDLSGVVDVANLGVGGLLAPTGLAGDALVKSTGGGISLMRNPLAVAIGTIGLSCAASNTGSVKWVLYFAAIDPGATVTAA